MTSKRRRIVRLLLVGATGLGAALSLVFAFWAFVPKAENRFYLGESLAFYLEALDGEDPELRETALVALKRIGPEQARSISVLKHALDNDDKVVRIAIAGALGRIGERAVPVLRVVLDDPEKEVAEAAVRALGVTGDRGLRLLVGFLFQPGHRLGDAAATVIQEVGQEAKTLAPILVALLKFEEFEHQRGVFHGGAVSSALKNVQGAATPYLIESIKSEGAGLDHKARLVNILEKIGGAGASALPLFQDLILAHGAVAAGDKTDRERERTWHFIDSMFKTMESIGVESTATLIALLRSTQDDQIQMRALDALYLVCKTAVRADRNAKRRATSKKPKWTTQRTTTRPNRGRRGTSQIEVDLATVGVDVEQIELGRHELVEFLYHEDDEIQRRAAVTLALLGAIAHESFDDVFHRLSKQMSMMSAEWMGEMDAPASPLRTANYGARVRPFEVNGKLRESYLHVILSMGPAAVESLSQTLESADRTERLVALFVLRHMGRAAASARAALFNAARSHDVVERAWAVRALSAVAEDAVSTAEQLVRLYGEELRTAWPGDFISTSQSGRMTDVFAEALHELGAPIVPYLTKLLDDPDMALRLLAMRALRPNLDQDQTLAGAEAAVPALLRNVSLRSHLLDAEVPDGFNSNTSGLVAAETTKRTFTILGSLGVGAREYVPAVLTLARDTLTRDGALTVLQGLGATASDVAPTMFSMLVHEAKEARLAEPMSRGEAVLTLSPSPFQALAAMGVDAFPAIAESCDSPDADVRYWALATLAQIASQGNRRPLGVRKRNVKTSRGPGRTGTRTPDKVARVSRKSSPQNFDGSLTFAVPLFVSLTRDDDEEIRALAVDVLSEVNLWHVAEVPGDVGQVVERLVELLQKPDDEANFSNALEILTRLGPAAAPAASRLIHHLVAEVRKLEAGGVVAIFRETVLFHEPPQSGVRRNPQRPRGGLTVRRPRKAHPRVQEARTYYAFERALREMGPAAAVPLLARLDQVDESEAVRRVCALLVDVLKPSGEVAVPTLVRALEVEDELLRNRIVALLAGYGELSEPALPVLLRHVRSAGERLKGSRGAERAIQTQRIRGFFRAIGQVGSKAIPHLVDLLDFPDAQIRYFAARTLTDLDADARDVQSGLRRLLNDEEPAIRYFARWAIGKLDERRGAEHRSGVAGK